MIQPVILCGGSGTRLWPLSTNDIPKQFIELGDQGNFLRQTINRLKSITPIEPLLVMNEDHSRNIKGNILTEPYANDTGVAVARSVYYLSQTLPLNTTILVIPSDHYIKYSNNFSKDIITGINRVIEDNIVLWGIDPTFPETKYGYILESGNNVFFKEKPDALTATILINQGALWNSGIFAAKLSLLINLVEPLKGWITDPRPGKAASFDVAILQEHNKLTLIPGLNWGWSDVGTWNSFLELEEIKKEINNHECKISNSHNVTILNRNNSKIVTIGVSNLLIVTSENNLLIMDQSQDHSNILKSLIS